MASFFESEAYQELAQAAIARDYARQAAIVEKQVATTQGAEHSFWLNIRLSRKIEWCITPRDFRRLVPELDTIVAAAPSDPDMIHSIATSAANLYIVGEYSDPLVRVLPLIRPYRHELLKSYTTRGNLGLLLQKKRRWPSAFRNHSLALELFEQIPQAQRETQGGYRYFMYSHLAVAAVALKRYDDAAAAIAGARAIVTQRPPGYFHPAVLSLAEAALAHAHGEYQQARSILQTSNATSSYPLAPSLQISFLLMAARIARSEGNPSSFAHFCEQARALCAEYDMPLSAAAVEAVANGAEY